MSAELALWLDLEAVPARLRALKRRQGIESNPNRPDGRELPASWANRLEDLATRVEALRADLAAVDPDRSRGGGS